MRMLAALLSVAAAWSLQVAPAVASILAVPADYPDIASALNAAASGDEVVVSAGAYLEHDLVLPSGVVLRGATGNPADVVIDSERLGRCIYGQDLAAGTRIEAITLSHGLPAWGETPHNSWGAGLMVDGGSPTISNCIFTANETAIGGGAFIRGPGSPVFENCTFDANEATESAGLLLSSVGDPVVRDCEFRNGNRCLVGGGLTWTGSGSLLVERCTIENNAVIESGGGLEVYGPGATATVRESAIRGNSASLFGGGVVVSNQGTARFENCEISGNLAPDGPDGFVAAAAEALLVCCDVDSARWTAHGTLTLDDDSCITEGTNASWGRLKSIFH